MERPDDLLRTLPILLHKFLHDIRNVNGTSYCLLGVEERDSGFLYQPRSGNSSQLNWEIIHAQVQKLNTMFTNMGQFLNQCFTNYPLQKSPGDFKAFLEKNIPSNTWPSVCIKGAIPADISLDWMVLGLMFQAIFVMLTKGNQDKSEPLTVTVSRAEESIILTIQDPNLTLTPAEFKDRMNPFLGSRHWEETMGLALNAGHLGVYTQLESPETPGTTLSVTINLRED